MSLEERKPSQLGSRRVHSGKSTKKQNNSTFPRGVKRFRGRRRRWRAEGNFWISSKMSEAWGSPRRANCSQGRGASRKPRGHIWGRLAASLRPPSPIYVSKFTRAQGPSAFGPAAPGSRPPGPWALGPRALGPPFTRAPGPWTPGPWGPPVRGAPRALGPRAPGRPGAVGIIKGGRRSSVTRTNTAHRR